MFGALTSFLTSCATAGRGLIAIALAVADIGELATCQRAQKSLLRAHLAYLSEISNEGE